MSDLLEIPFFDDDVYKLLFRFSINILFLFLIIHKQYYRNSKNREYLFTYYLIGILVFMLCFTLKKNELGIGMALGLFAIFGIIRYRTDTINIKEMTYLFVVIGLSVINSLANKKMSFIEILLVNSIVVIAIALLEQFWNAGRESKKKILYEKIELVKPEKYDDLKKDLESRTGLSINRIIINDINFLRDTADITIFYDSTPNNSAVK